jgi:hypothetical protein
LSYKNLIHKSIYCERCNTWIKCDYLKKYAKCAKCYTNYSFLKNSIFWKKNLSPDKIVLLLYYFSKNQKIKNVVFETNISEKSVSRWFDTFRELICNFMFEKKQKKMIGSFDKIIEIDEACFGRRKYHKGKYTRSSVWVLGGIERGTNHFFIEIVKNRSKNVLQTVIKRNVRKNSFIFTDEWKGYYGLNLIGYHHYTVNHSKTFRNKASGVHTNTIEGFWHILRVNTPNVSTNKKKEYFIEFMWRKIISELDPFEELIKIITYYYCQ